MTHGWKKTRLSVVYGTKDNEKRATLLHLQLIPILLENLRRVKQIAKMRKTALDIAPAWRYTREKHFRKGFHEYQSLPPLHDCRSG